MQRGQQVIEHGDEREEGDEHRGDVDGEQRAVGGPCRRRIDDVGMLALDSHLHLAARDRLLHLGIQNLGQVEPARRRHHARRQDRDRIGAKGDVDGHHSP